MKSGGQNHLQLSCGDSKQVPGGRALGEGYTALVREGFIRKNSFSMNKDDVKTKLMPVIKEISKTINLKGIFRGEGPSSSHMCH